LLEVLSTQKSEVSSWWMLVDYFCTITDSYSASATTTTTTTRPQFEVYTVSACQGLWSNGTKWEKNKNKKK